jgi:outer membrane cobalamin receptor
MMVSLLCGVGQANADSSSLDSIQTLGEVMVTANRYNEVIPSQKLTGKELKALNSFSVADAIRYFSGLQIKDYGGVGGLKTVNIRSMGTNHMGVYYNGIQLGNAQNGQVDLGKFSLENIEEISLYNGQKSEIFQSAREFGSAGSIYLTTRRPKFKPGEKSHLKASVKAGSFDLLNPSVLFEYKLSETVSMTFNSEWINSSGKYKFRYRRHTIPRLPVKTETSMPFGSKEDCKVTCPTVIGKPMFIIIVPSGGFRGLSSITCGATESVCGTGILSCRVSINRILPANMGLR